MPRHLITQQELEREIANWLEANPEHDLTEDVERAQMALASPGTWEVAKVTPEPEPDGTDSSDVPDSTIIQT